MNAAVKQSHRHGSWAWLLIVPPLLAVIGGMLTLYVVVRYPDHEIKVDNETQQSAHQHVINSVTPPLK